MTMLKPVVPGTVLRFIGESIPRVEPSASDTVAIPIVHDSGPIGSDPVGTSGREGGMQLCNSFSEFTEIFGDSDTAGRTAVAGAFAGQNMPGKPGAGAVLVYRMAGAGKAKATLAVKNTAAAEALKLTARYYGVRGNSLSIVIDVDPSNAARERLRILYKGATAETYLYAKTNVKQLVEAINVTSKLVAATEVATGTALKTTTGESLVGGNSGETLTALQHLEALEAIEYKPFSIIAPFQMETVELLNTYLSWVKVQEEANRPVILVIGGGSADTLAEAITRTNTCESAHVVNFGVGVYHDDLLNKDLNTAQLAPRMAGILASRGKKSSITFAEIGGLHVVGNSAPSSDEVKTAVQSGVCVLMHATSPEAELHIAKGVTTMTSTSRTAEPLEIFGDPRLVRIMDLYIRDMKEWGDKIVIGSLPVNDDTRATVRGKARELQDALLGDGLILPGGEVLGGVEVPKPFVTVNPPTDPGYLDTVPYQFGWQFARTTNAILGEGRVR